MTQVVKTRDDDNLSYVNGLDLFGHKDAINLPDDLHPNPDGYVTMGERFATMHLAQQSKAISL